jgi:hypothetical protein
MRNIDGKWSKSLYSMLEGGRKKFFWPETKQRVDKICETLSVTPNWKELEKLKRKSPKARAPQVSVERRPRTLRPEPQDLRAQLQGLIHRVDDGKLSEAEAFILIRHHLEQ